jgi:hypothetical protein
MTLEGPGIKKPLQDGGRFQAAEKFFEIEAIPGLLRQFMPGADAAGRRQQKFLLFPPD